MAKKTTAKATPKVTKTDAIREELKRSKNGSPSEIAKKLAARGIKVTPEYVSTIKASDKRKALAGGPRRKPGRPAGSTRTLRYDVASDDVRQTSELLEKAFDLVLQVGADEARQLIATAERMIRRAKT